jgi:membrane-associated protease RseP (regulator of RpoE activity)
MKHFAQVICVLFVIFVSVRSARPAAQLTSDPFVFYGEEPWGGSYLGVDTEDITSERLGALHLKDERGVEVTMVDQDAPAGKAGIKEHDVILSINDQQVQSVEQLRRLIHEIPAGRSITIGISRQGQPMTLHAQLAERNKMPEMKFNFRPEINVPVVHVPPINIPEMDIATNVVVVHTPRSSGMMIENLTPQLGEFFGVKGGNGVLVRSVEKGSRAEQAGLHAGDVIVKINGSAVNDCSDFSRLLHSRTTNKATVVVVRDRREQTLTLSLPESKRTGELQNENCDLLEAACADLREATTDIAALVPGMTADLKDIQPEIAKLKKQMQEEMKKQKPAMEKLQKQIQEQVRSRQSEWREDMEKMREGMEKQKEEFKKQFSEFHKHNAEI